MYLKSITLQGFKSFAEKTTLLFSAPDASGQLPLTAVVGPNGSGKSNVADAIRWVLGEQSIKVIRGKKSEDVIFAGSSRRARTSLAEVSLAVVNDDGKIPIEAHEVAIARRLYRDGESEYMLNNKTTRLMDIQMLLAKAAFGKEGYSVIGQGQIDAILTASPEERKVFFDEATGVRPLQIKKEQSLKKLATTEENLWQAQMLRDEIAPRLRSLSRQVKRAEKREEVERELQELQMQYYGALLFEMNKEQGTLNKRTQEIEELKNRKTEELKKIEAEMKALEKEETKPEALLKIQNEYEKLIAAKERLREREFELKRKMLEVKKDAAAVPVHEIVSVLEVVKGELHSVISSEARNLTPSIGQGVRSLAGARDDMIKKLHPLLNSLSSLLSRLKGETAPKQTAALQVELTKLADDLKAADGELETLRVRLQELSRGAEAKKQSFFEVQKRLTAKQAELHSAEAEFNNARIELARIETRRESLEAEARQEMSERYDTLKSLAGSDATKLSFDRELQPEIQKLKRQLEAIGSVDEETLKEYKEVKERHDFLQSQIADLEQSLQSLVALLEELDQTIKTQFASAFEKINTEFGNYFKILFGGGQAKLGRIVAKDEPEVLEESSATSATSATLQERPSLLDRFTKKDSYRGVEITASPPGKKLKSIAMLSGGEKALTSIALLSAILALNPPPFVVLDEVDAALDESNSARFASILTELAHTTQFIVITHNRATMQAAEVLYGVTMGDDGVSKILSLKFEEAKEVK